MKLNQIKVKESAHDNFKRGFTDSIEHVISEAAHAVLEIAENMAYDANGDVDIDGIDDFIGPAHRKFSQQVLELAKTKLRENS
jgi:hypothetical protein